LVIGENVNAASTSGQITITLEKDSTIGGALTVTGTSGVIIAGDGTLDITDKLDVDGPIIFSGGNVTLAAADNEITGTTLTVENDTLVTAGAFVFGKGVYTATGTITIDVTGDTIAGGTANDQLALGDNKSTDAKLLTLVGTGAFEADGKVTLSGIGDGAIVVEPDSSASSLTVSNNAELKLGNGVIALGHDGTDEGSLVIDNGGGKLSGFTYHKENGATHTLHNGTDAQQHSFTVASLGGRAILGKYYTDGVTITAGNGTYAYDFTTALVGTVTGAGASAISYAAAPIHGGIIHKDSDVAY
jgi:hypothetical protein